MAAKATGRRRVRDTSDDVQVLRVRARLASDEYWTKEMARSTEAVRGLARYLDILPNLNLAMVERPFTEAVKEVVQQLQAFRMFAELVHLVEPRQTKVTTHSARQREIHRQKEIQRRRDVWDAFHAWVANELKAARRQRRASGRSRP